MTALTSDGLTKIVPALIEAQASFKAAVKDSTNPAFKSKYASLDAVLDAVKDALIHNQIALLQQTDRDDDGTTVLVTRLVHVSGEWVASLYPVRPVKADPQGEGSALTYARRYALMALVGIAPEDDDGNAASVRPKRDWFKDAASLSDPDALRLLWKECKASGELTDVLSTFIRDQAAKFDSPADGPGEDQASLDEGDPWTQAAK